MAVKVPMEGETTQDYRDCTTQKKSLMLQSPFSKKGSLEPLHLHFTLGNFLMTLDSWEIQSALNSYLKERTRSQKEPTEQPDYCLNNVRRCTNP